MAAMEQVMGRAIRFQSHRRRPKVECNVACFLHVTVPEDPTDTRFAHVPSSAARVARIPPMVRYVGDLHAYYRVHQKVGGIAHVQQIIRTDALDAVSDVKPSCNSSRGRARTTADQSETQRTGKVERSRVSRHGVSTLVWHARTSGCGTTRYATTSIRTDEVGRKYDDT